MIEETLYKLGFTQNEVKVYVTLLQIGESKTGEILKKSGLNSGRIYETLDSLQKKGLVSIILRAGVKYFSPADPKRVLDYLGDRRRELDDQEEDYKKILPSLLEKVDSLKEESKIEIYAGVKGMKTAYAKELDFPKGTALYVYNISSSQNYPKEVWDFFETIHRP